MLPISVVIADDHPSFRRGLHSVLTSGKAGAGRTIEVVGEAGSGREAVEQVERHEPDVLVLDVEMPEGSGLDVARELQRRKLATRILALSSYDSAEYVRGLFEAGASGYVTKDKPPYLLREAVRGVAHGDERWFERPEVDEGPLAELTSREFEVLRLIARGDSHAEIADQLNISASTARRHATRVYHKIGVSSAREAIVWAWQNGVVERS